MCLGVPYYAFTNNKITRIPAFPPTVGCDTYAPQYRLITVEFLSTFRYRPQPPDFQPQPGQAQQAEVSFRLCGAAYQQQGIADSTQQLVQQQAHMLSASSPQSTHVSSSQSWEYDVFLSFKGEDTRKTFIDHLYSALVYRQIITYKDDLTLTSGESITSLLIKNIQKSRIAVIIFSKNYAASSVCLDELAFIMKNRDEQGQILMPIFYDVEPSEVREQTGHYREALRNYEYNKNKVQSWREALTRAGGLPGWECSNRHDVIYMIIKICDDILVILSSDLSISEESCETSTNTYLIGMETRMQELILSLKVGSGGVDMVGICGMWGSGKSTLASSVYDEISHEFEGSCFVKNVRARSRIHGLKTLQEEILSNVLKSEVTFTNLEQGTHMMETRLRDISVLIVLDDVHHTDHLRMLAGSQNWFGKGSRVIFTTRNQYLFDDHSARTYNVRMLNDTEAIEVFSWHAFGKREPLQGFKEDSVLSMVSKCGGHPSVLQSLGSFLHGKHRSEWMRILDRLEVLHGSVGSRFVLGFDPENEEASVYVLGMFKVWKKAVYVDRLLQLFKYVPREQLTIPDFVF
ncbi:hypothetical protein R6Q59_030396 [Mikania micrantha]